MVTDADIAESNPWWTDRTEIDGDKKIVEWSRSGIRFVPGMLDRIRYDPDPGGHVVYTLRGPRQVGKTTMIMLQIRRFLEAGVEPHSILYYALDGSREGGDVADLVKRYMRMTKGLRGERSYLFLDEISSIRDWGTQIKVLVDRGILRDCAVVASGSHTLNLATAQSRLTGRMGAIPDDDYHHKILLPMSFYEYVTLMGDGSRRLLSGIDTKKRHAILAELASGEVGPQARDLGLHMGELGELLDDYMLTGGFPQAISEKKTLGYIPQKVYTTHLENITSTWNSISKDVGKLKQLCKALIGSQSGRVSWRDLATSAGLGSHRTAQDYVDTLEKLHATFTIYQYNTDTRGRMYVRNAKVYFGDPLLLHAFNAWSGTDDAFAASRRYLEGEENRGGVVEGIVADHLVRWSFERSRKKQMFDHSDCVFYWRDKKGREVDFVLYDGQDAVPIEVKFRNRIRRGDLGGMASFLDRTGRKGGIAVSKDVLDARGDCAVVPAAMFLLLL